MWPWTICLTSRCFHIFTDISLTWRYIRMQVEGPGMYVALPAPANSLFSPLRIASPESSKPVFPKHQYAKNHSECFLKQTFPCSAAVGQRWDWDACSPTTGQLLKPHTEEHCAQVSPILWPKHTQIVHPQIKYMTQHFLLCKYNRCFLSAGSTSKDSTNHGSNILRGEKISRKFQEAKLEFAVHRQLFT